MRIINFILIIIVLTLIIHPWVEAQTVLKAGVIGNGGGPMEGGGYRINGTIGQAAIGPSMGASNGAFGGFWYIVNPPSEPVPAIGLNPTSFSFSAPSGGPNPATKKLYITNTGTGTLDWNVSSNADWLTLNPTSGSCANETDEVTLSVDVAGLADNVYNATITITATGASNTPQTVSVDLKVGGWQRQLAEGWNFISFPISNCYYDGMAPSDQPTCVNKVDVHTIGRNSLSAWFSSVLDPSDAWDMVIGPNGIMDRSLPPASHSLTYMSPISAYWVKIKAGGAILTIYGPPFDPNCVIQLFTGWNQVGFPLAEGYHDTVNEPTELPWVTDWQKVNPPVAEYVFDSIKGQVDMVIGQFGAYNPALPAALSSLHHVSSGCGYWIKVKQDVNLKYSDMGTSALAAPFKR